jgi:hypothetical protein
MLTVRSVTHLPESARAAGSGDSLW